VRKERKYSLHLMPINLMPARGKLTVEMNQDEMSINTVL